MKPLFYLAAFLCLTAWAVSVFIYSATDLIHSLLAFSIVFVIMGSIGSDQPAPSSSNSDMIY